MDTFHISKVLRSRSHPSCGEYTTTNRTFDFPFALKAKNNVSTTF